MVLMLLTSTLKRFLFLNTLPWGADGQRKQREFVDFLFDKLFSHVDTDMIDLHDDDSCCDHLEFENNSAFSDAYYTT